MWHQGSRRIIRNLFVFFRHCRRHCFCPRPRGSNHRGEARIRHQMFGAVARSGGGGRSSVRGTPGNHGHHGGGLVRTVVPSRTAFASIRRGGGRANIGCDLSRAMRGQGWERIWLEASARVSMGRGDQANAVAAEDWGSVGPSSAIGELHHQVESTLRKALHTLFVKWCHGSSEQMRSILRAAGRTSKRPQYDPTRRAKLSGMRGPGATRAHERFECFIFSKVQ